MRWVLSFFMLLVAVYNPIAAKSGIIVTTPEAWLRNQEEQVCIHYHEINHDMQTVISLKSGDDILKRVEVNSTNGNDFCQPVIVTGQAYEFELLVQSHNAPGTEGPEYNFTKSSSISVIQNNMEANITFIETDKPLYKAGDKVNIRILTIDEKLKPRLEEMSLVTVENPHGIRIMQWRNIQVVDQQGLSMLDFQLSSEPSLGQWKITAVRPDGSRHEQMFEVKEYVPPKFEVVVKTEPYIGYWFESTDVEICARYTYGQPVKGQLTVGICLESYYNFASVCQNHTLKIEGCGTANFSFNSSTSDIFGTRHGSHYLSVNATVREDGTGTEISSLKESTTFGNNRFELSFVDPPKYFKPGMPFIGKVSLVSNAGDSVEGHTVKIEVQHAKTSTEPFLLTTDNTGHVTFELPDVELDDKNENIYITAALQGSSDQDATTSMTVKSWFSPSNSYMVIADITDPAPCQNVIRVVVQTKLTNFQNLNYLYRLNVQHKIVAQNTKGDKSEITFQADSIAFDIRLPEGMVYGPASLLVFTVVGDGEIVADTTTFNIKHCAENQVKMEFSQSEVAPGDDVSLALAARPGSLCAYGVMDKSMKLLGGDNMVTFDSIINKVPMKVHMKYGFYRHNDEYCRKQLEKTEEEKTEEESQENEDLVEENSRRRHRPPGQRRAQRPKRPDRNRAGQQKRSIMPYIWNIYYSRYVDAAEAFEMSSLVVMTDLTLDSRPCESKSDDRPRHHVYYSAPLGLPGMAGPIGVAEEGVLLAVPQFSFNTLDTTGTKVVNTVRSFFPEAWLWELAAVGPSGTVKVPRKAPDTITEWVGHAVCTSVEHGLGISQEATLRTFQPFFVSLTLPYSAIRGETMQLPVSVFNYLSECLVISLDVLPSSDYSNGNGSVLCVCGQDKVTHHIPITALALGKINITITAESVDTAQVCGNVIMSSQIGVRDTVIRELLVEPEGKEMENSFNSFMCPNEEDNESALHQWMVPLDIVADSLRTYVSVIGDVMGPALSGLDSLIKLPTGCGEQNMLKFAPNIFVLQYLTHTHQLTQEMEKTCLEYMRIGYQRELEYRHSDGSYSAFGTNDDSGSTWLTAFVLKSFSQAKEFIDIDESDLQVTRSWFEQNQMENGCFRDVGSVLHKSMKGGLESSTGSLAPLTAYSLIALLEAGYDPKSNFVLDAVRCLTLQQFNDTYTTALVSYAFSLLGRDSTLALLAFNKLQTFKNQHGGYAYWKVPVSDSEHDVVRAVDVETTAYALLAHMNMVDTLNNLDTQLPIVRWLTSQRNPEGGFLSTQDTVVALHAMAKFAEKVKGQGSKVDVNVKVTDEEHNFSVEPGNSLLLQSATVNKALSPGNLVGISMSATGDMCAYVQTSMKYNILNVTTGSTHNIHLTVDVDRTPDNKCDRRILKTCIRYDGPDDKTNMALLVINMVTGWSPIKSTVEKLKHDAKLRIAREEVEKKYVNLYITELLKNVEICVIFEVEEEIEVRNSIPATVTISDYYDEQGVFKQVAYSMKSICGTKEELSFNPIDMPDGEISQQRQPLPHFPGNPGNTGVFSNPEQPADNKCSRCDPETLSEDELTQMLCKTNHVYKGMVQKSNEVQVQKDLTDNTKINRLVTVNLNEECSCPLLEKKKKWLWIMSNSTEIEETGSRKGVMQISSSDIVMPIPKKSRNLEALLKRVKRSRACRDV